MRYSRSCTRQNDHWKGRIAHSVLKRWLEDDDAADAMWLELKTTLPADLWISEIPPAMFIGQVIQTRILAHRADKASLDSADLIDAAKQQLKTAFGQLDIEALCAIGGPLKRAVTMRGAISRQAGAGRTWFMWTWSESFRLVCGKPLDAIVARLTEIAFAERDIDINDVRMACRTMDRVRGKYNRGALKP